MIHITIETGVGLDPALVSYVFSKGRTVFFKGNML